MSLVNYVIVPIVLGNNLYLVKLGGVVEEPIAFHPPASIQIPTKSGHFTIENNNVLFVFTPSTLSDLNLMEEADHVPCRFLPRRNSKESRVGANSFIGRERWC